MLGVLLIFAARCLLVALFFPFSALDKSLNPQAAVDQAHSVVPGRGLAAVLIGAGLLVEVTMSLAILSGIADRLAAFILAGYCVVTALCWKRFWQTPDFRLRGPSKGREMFWDFLKNLAVAGGFAMLALGATASGVQAFLAHPLASSHPYATHAPQESP